MILFINGSFLSEESPIIYANDRGLLLGDGLFETIKSVNGALRYFDRHYNRLKKAAAILEIPLSYSSEDLKHYGEQLLRSNQLMDQVAAVRITLTRGRSARGISVSSSSPTLLITAVAYDESVADRPIRMMVTDNRRNEYSVLTTLKTTQYLESIMARQSAQACGFDEGMLLNTKGMLTESSVANVFFVKDSHLITPPISDGVLPGIMRQLILDYCATIGMSVEERSVTPAELYDMTAAFQTNSLIGIQLISCFDDYYLPELSDNSIIRRLKNDETESN
jgi:branched-chain amino acid aminotransferase